MKKFLKSTSFILLGLLFVSILNSCSDENAVKPDATLDSEQLINAIQSSANKVVITENELPANSVNTIKNSYAGNFNNQSFKAPELGYEVVLRKEKGAKAGKLTKTYFDLDGNELKSNAKNTGDVKDKDKDGDDEFKECFEIIYPITFTMPDGSVLTVNDDNGWDVIEDWYMNNPDSEEEPKIQYPISVKLADGTTKAINSDDELFALEEACGWYDEEFDWDWDLCFDFVYPVSLTMPDGSAITVENEEGWNAIEDWYEANPDSFEEPVVQYPVNVILEDGTEVTVNNDDEFEELFENCEYHCDYEDEECFDFVYPISLTMPDGSTITVENEDGWDLLDAWYDANPDSEEDPAIQYPVDVKFEDGTVKTVNNDDELEEIEFACYFYDDDFKECYEFVLPITFTMPDSTSITVNDEGGWDTLEEWYDANPTSEDEPVIQYPIDVKFEDGTVKTVNNDEELDAIDDACYDEMDDEDDGE